MHQLYQIVDKIFLFINGVLGKIFFADVFFFADSFKFPLVVFLLFSCGIFLTLRMNFVNIRLFTHACKILFSKPKTQTLGDISHFKALTTALSATVGLGNIAGVAIAISVGGPGACLWMIIMGLIGMNTKFTECTLGIMYREKRQDGRIMGGPMRYLKNGLKDLGYPNVGRALALCFSIFCLMGSFGGGVAFQVNQSLTAVSLSIPALSNYKWAYGLILIILTSLVIIGGIKRIARVSSITVPWMCGIYLLMSLIVLIAFYKDIPEAIVIIVQSAFNFKAGIGGFMGVLIVGLQRAAFSNEAGLGSSPIAHSAAKVDHPVEEGSVALLEPFIDTVVICTITALVIVVTGVHDHPDYAHLVAGQQGAALTSQALNHVSQLFPHILSLSVFLFAFSTIISWSYYGDRCWTYLFGEKFSIVYKILILVVIFMGAVAKSTIVMDFCDLMILSMSIPNLIGVILLSKKVYEAKQDYIQNHL